MSSTPLFSSNQIIKLYGFSPTYMLKHFHRLSRLGYLKILKSFKKWEFTLKSIVIQR